MWVTARQRIPNGYLTRQFTHTLIRAALTHTRTCTLAHALHRVPTRFQHPLGAGEVDQVEAPRGGCPAVGACGHVHEHDAV